MSTASTPGTPSDGRPGEHVFVVRVWTERAASAPQLRATVEDVSSGNRLASTDLRDVDDFIRLRIRGDGPPQVEPNQD